MITQQIVQNAQAPVYTEEIPYLVQTMFSSYTYMYSVGKYNHGTIYQQ